MEIKKTVLDIITLDQLHELREAGFIVVHRVPTERMDKASLHRGEFSYLDHKQIYHRMVGESIKIQNEELIMMGKIDKE